VGSCRRSKPEHSKRLRRKPLRKDALSGEAGKRGGREERREGEGEGGGEEKKEEEEEERRGKRKRRRKRRRRRKKKKKGKGRGAAGKKKKPRSASRVSLRLAAAQRFHFEPSWVAPYHAPTLNQPNH